MNPGSLEKIGSLFFSTVYTGILEGYLKKRKRFSSKQGKPIAITPITLVAKAAEGDRYPPICTGATPWILCSEVF